MNHGSLFLASISIPALLFACSSPNGPSSSTVITLGGGGAGNAAASSNGGSPGTGAGPGTGGATGTGGESGDGGAPFSCTVTVTEHACYLYEGFSAAKAADLMSNCTQAKSTLGTTCPTTDVRGTCTITESGTTTIISFYTDSASAVSDDQSLCASASGTYASG